MITEQRSIKSCKRENWCSVCQRIWYIIPAISVCTDLLWSVTNAVQNNSSFYCLQPVTKHLEFHKYILQSCGLGFLS